MLMIPTKKPAGRLIDLPRGPQFLAAMFWDGSTSSETIKHRAVTWMKTVGRPVRDATVALEAIAWAEGLPLLKKILGTEDWLAILCGSMSANGLADKKILRSEDWLALGEFLLSLPAEVDSQTLKDQPLVHQLLAGELALTLATRLSRAPLSRRLEKSGQAAISLGLNQILDRQGMLPAEHFRALRSLLACWTRCRTLAAELPRGGSGPRAELRYQRLVRNALRCIRPDGRPLLAEDERNPSEGDSWGRELFEAVLNGGAEEIDRRLAAGGLPNLSPGAVAKAPKKSADLPPPSIYFEDGAIAVMRRNWNRDDERVAVLFAGQTCELELVASGRVAASGAWRFEITQQGQQLQPVSHWESSCWYTDEDVDYLELEIELTGGVKLERQIVLAREDRFLILADALMSPYRGDLEYRSVLPLAPHVEFRGTEESREGFLVHGQAATCPTGKQIGAACDPASLLAQGRRAAAGGKSAASARPLAQVIPLGLPEWRADQCHGALKTTAEGLELRQSTAGQRLFAPIFIDLDRSRFRRRMTWRQLTVAERLAAVPSETAVGFRVAIGDQQWIIYRSLAAKSNRTLLGHNLATESLIARFGKDGEVTSIVEIE